MKDLIPTERIEQAIFLIRGQKVLLDADLALIYGVPTKGLNQAVKRNLRRFPSDFLFRLTVEELEAIQSQIAAGSNRSQIVTGSQKHRNPRLLPYAFTEHGAIMAATVLNSPPAVTMSVYVVRAFIQMREHLAVNQAILKRLAEIDKTLLEHDQSLSAVWHKLRPLLQPQPEPPRPRIGFRT